MLRELGITNISLKEIVPETVYNSYPEPRLIQFIDLRVWRGWQWVRTERGIPIYFNTWAVKPHPDYPVFQGRGLRIGDGFQSSQHYYARAGDGDEYGTPAVELWDWIMKLDNQKALLEIGITTIEDIAFTETWVHMDCRNWPRKYNRLQVVAPAPSS